MRLFAESKFSSIVDAVSFLSIEIFDITGNCSGRQITSFWQAGEALAPKSTHLRLECLNARKRLNSWRFRQLGIGNWPEQSLSNMPNISSRGDLSGSGGSRFCMIHNARRRAAHASIFSLSRSTKRAAHGQAARTLADSILPRSSKECFPFL